MTSSVTSKRTSWIFGYCMLKYRVKQFFDAILFILFAVYEVTAKSNHLLFVLSSFCSRCDSLRRKRSRSAKLYALCKLNIAFTLLIVALLLTMSNFLFNSRQRRRQHALVQSMRSRATSVYHLFFFSCSTIHRSVHIRASLPLKI